MDKDYLQTSQHRVQIEDANCATLELMVDHLTQQLAEMKKKNALLAVDVWGNTRAVWMRESTEWVKQCGVPDECPIENDSVCVSRVSDGLVVAGGWIGLGKPSSQCHHFSLSTGQWRKLENMRTPRSWARAAEVEEMMLLMVGGSETGGKVSDVCERLDVRRGMWTPAASLSKPLSCALVAAAAGQVYILQEGSFSDTPNFLFVDYNPASDTHKQRSSMPEHVNSTLYASLVGVADKIYLFGGLQKLALQYEPATEQWHELGSSTAMVGTEYYPIVRSTDILLCKGRPECYEVGDDGSDESGSDGDSLNRSISYNVETKQWKVLDFCLPFRYDPIW